MIGALKQRRREERGRKADPFRGGGLTVRKGVE